MLKSEYFKKAIQAGEYKRKSWVMSIFSLIKEAPAAWQKDSTPYRLVQTPTAYFYIDPENNNQLYPIDDAIPGEPLFNIKDKISLKANELPNLSVDIITTYGRVLFNCAVLVNAFNNKIPYINTRVSASELEKIILPLLKDTPNTDNKDDNFIYIDEYLRFCDSMFYLGAFTQLCVPTATKKVITAAPGVIELKNKLLEQYKDTLDDPATIAKIDAELVQYDKDYMKGDLGEGFLINNEAYSKVRKKLFSMHGAESGLENKVEVDLIPNSLSQGWDINKFPEMNNSLRSGIFDRGTETMKGGEAFKWLQRSSSNINITIKDCGTKLGNTITITDSNYNYLVGFNIFTNSGPLMINDDTEAKQYIGKTVTVRSPMYCKVDKTDYCHTCVGRNLSDNPTGASVAITGFGSILMLLSMKKMHGRVLSLVKMNYKEAIL